MRTFTLKVRVGQDDIDDDDLVDWSQVEESLCDAISECEIEGLYVDVECDCGRDCCGDGCCCSGDSQEYVNPYIDRVDVVKTEERSVIGADVADALPSSYFPAHP